MSDDKPTLFDDDDDEPSTNGAERMEAVRAHARRPPPDAEEPVELDAAKSRELAREGAARSDRTKLRAEFDEAISRTATRHDKFCVDQVWEVRGTIPNAHGAASGMGPAIQRAIKAGLIEPVPGEYWESTRPEAHMKPQRVYHSLIYRGGVLMPQLKRCPYCKVKLKATSGISAHRCEQPHLTARQAWAALQAATGDDIDAARAEFVRALERVGS